MGFSNLQSIVNPMKRKCVTNRCLLIYCHMEERNMLSVPICPGTLNGFVLHWNQWNQKSNDELFLWISKPRQPPMRTMSSIYGELCYTKPWNFVGYLFEIAFFSRGISGNCSVSKLMCIRCLLATSLHEFFVAVDFLFSSWKTGNRPVSWHTHTHTPAAPNIVYAQEFGLSHVGRMLFFLSFSCFLLYLHFAYIFLLLYLLRWLLHMSPCQWSRHNIRATTLIDWLQWSGLWHAIRYLWLD